MNANNMQIKGTFRFIRLVIFASYVFAFTCFSAACSGDSTDSDKGQTDDAPNTRQNAGGIDTRIGGSGAVEGSGGTQAAFQAANPVECSMGIDLGAAGPMFSSRGVCQRPTDTCVGGTPDHFDLAALVRASVQGVDDIQVIIGSFPLPTAQANCDDGFVCCINTDQCERAGLQISSNPIISPFAPGLHTACTSDDACSERKGTPMQVGCPESQMCCVYIQMDNAP
jgi:hypothetical protein